MKSKYYTPKRVLIMYTLYLAKFETSWWPSWNLLPSAVLLRLSETEECIMVYSPYGTHIIATSLPQSNHCKLQSRLVG